MAAGMSPTISFSGWCRWFAEGYHHRKTNIDHIMQRNLAVVSGCEKYEHKKRGKMKVSDHPMLTAKLQQFSL